MAAQYGILAESITQYIPFGNFRMSQAKLDNSKYNPGAYFARYPSLAHDFVRNATCNERGSISSKSVFKVWHFIWHCGETVSEILFKFSLQTKIAYICENELLYCLTRLRAEAHQIGRGRLGPFAPACLSGPAVCEKQEEARPDRIFEVDIDKVHFLQKNCSQRFKDGRDVKDQDLRS